MNNKLGLPGMDDYKQCPKCGEIKIFGEFTVDKTCKTGRKSWCKKCCSEKSIQYYYKHRERMCENGRKWRSENREKHRELVKRWQKTHKSGVQELKKRAYVNLRRTSRGRLKENFRTRVAMSIKRGCKGNHKWELIVGYTLQDLMRHLEKKFTPEMTWGNYGSYWHVDHKIPIAAFNFETAEDIDFKRCWALCNLQPLEAKENISKKDRLFVPLQPSLLLNLGSSISERTPE